MNRLGRRVGMQQFLQNNPRVALAMKATHALTDPSSEAGLNPPHQKLILT